MYKYFCYVLGIKFNKCTRCKTLFKAPSLESLCSQCQLDTLLNLLSDKDEKF